VNEPPAEIENRRINMFRSNSFSYRIFPIMAMVFVLVLGAAAFVLTHQNLPIPVSGGVTGGWFLKDRGKHKQSGL
jgi:hypothetical protein